MIGLIISCKSMFIHYKCYTIVKRMEMFTLIIYFIHGKYVDIMLSHHLWLNIQCDFTYATKGFLITKLIATIFQSQIVVANWRFFTIAIKI
jgi:hypothetical protein